MSDLRAAAQQALEALEQAHPKPYNEDVRAHVEAITALKAALEQPEPRREWVSLTDDERVDILFPLTAAGASDIDCARAIEAALKEKNHE